VATSSGDEGPYCLLARVHPDIERVELVTAAGENMQVPVYDSALFPEVRFAALLVPREHLAPASVSDRPERLAYLAQMRAHCALPRQIRCLAGVPDCAGRC
jgi:hypothetical protein